MKRWWIGLALAAMTATTQPACESCEFTYGRIQVSGTITVDGPPPADLTIRLCSSPEATSCLDTWVPTPADPANPPATSAASIAYEGAIPSEGDWSCSFDKHWLVITGTGCEETAIDVLGATSHGTPAPADSTALDATVYCGL